MSDKLQPEQTRTGVPSGYGQTAYKRELAYQHLGINPQDVERVPFLWPNLRGIARRLNRGRAEHAPLVCPLDLLQWSEDPEARKVLQKYLAVPESYRALRKTNTSSSVRLSAVTYEFPTLIGCVLRWGFWLVRVGEAETHSTIAHPQLLRNLVKACSFGTQPPYFVVIHNAAGTPKSKFSTTSIKIKFHTRYKIHYIAENSAEISDTKKPINLGKSIMSSREHG